MSIFRSGKFVRVLLTALPIFGSGACLAQTPAEPDARNAVTDLKGKMLQFGVGDTSTVTNAAGVQEQRRQEAISTSYQQLVSLKGPDFAFFIDRTLLTQAVVASLNTAKNGIEASQGDLTIKIGAPTIVLGNQTIAANIAAEFSYSKLSVTGTLGVGVFFALSGGPGTVTLGPALDHIEFTDVNVGSVPVPIESGALEGILNDLLRGLTNSINVHLTPVSITVPAPKPLTFNLAEAARKLPGLSISPATFTAPSLRAGEVAFLVTDAGIFGVGDLEIDGFAARTAKGVADPNDAVTYQKLTTEFLSLLASSFSVEQQQGIATIYMSNHRMAEYINNSWALLAMRASYHADDFRQTFPGTEVTLAESPTYSCRSDRQCNAQSCNRPAGRCAWSCTVKGPNVPCPTFGNPFRTCPTSFDEPGCLATRAACNAKEDAAVLRCNADQAAQKLDCERIKGQENIACGTGKALVDGLARLGPIARLGGDIGVSGTADIASANLVVANDFASARFSPSVAVNANVKVGLDFVPLNVGHVLTCPFPGKVFYSGIGGLPSQSWDVAARLSTIPDGDPSKLNLSVDINEFDINVRFSPPPVEGLVTQNPQLVFVCNPVLGAVGIGLSVIGSARAVIGESIIRRAAGNDLGGILTGSYTYKVKSMSFPVSVPQLRIQLGDLALAGVADLGTKAISIRLKAENP